MTRLNTADIDGIFSELDAYDRVLLSRTGLTLLGIGCSAAGIESVELASSKIEGRTVGIVSTTCGDGLLTTFAQTLGAIASHLGFDSFIADSVDVAGLAEVYERKADILLLADDNRFVAINTRTRSVSDNGEATGRGFAAGLRHMAGGFEGKPVLVIGCGPVGRAAALASAKWGAKVTLYDAVPDRSADLAMCSPLSAGGKFITARDLKNAIRNHDCIIEATPAPNLIDASLLGPRVLVAAPGIPCGLTGEARETLGDRLLHDPLQIGVATMLVAAGTE